MTDLPRIAQKAPFPIEMKEGETKFWCACGLSTNQPFCDGSHKGTEFVPQKFTAERDGTFFFCGCKGSERMPLCDGSHSKL